MRKTATFLVSSVGRATITVIAAATVAVVVWGFVMPIGVADGSDTEPAAIAPADATLPPVTRIAAATWNGNPGQSVALYFKDSVYHTATCTGGSNELLQAQLKMRATKGAPLVIGPEHTVSLSTSYKSVFLVAGTASDGRLIDYHVLIGSTYQHFQVDVLIEKGVGCRFRLAAFAND